MTELSTIAQIRGDGRVLIPKDTRQAGEIQPGDYLQLIITVVKRASNDKTKIKN